MPENTNRNKIIKNRKEFYFISIRASFNSMVWIVSHLDFVVPQRRWDNFRF